MELGLLALTIGGIIGGIVISKDGLGKWMLPMILDALTDPWICFISAFSSLLRLLYLCYCYCGAIWIRLFFAAFMMYLIYVADGESKTLITLLLLDLWH
jgi:PAT family beta-lactamase induction signal transducer AmpG